VGDGGRWWGGVDEVTAAAGSCVGLRKPGLWVLGQKPKTGPPGLGLGRAVGDSGVGRRAGLWGGVDEVVAVVRTSIRARTRGRGLGPKKKSEPYWLGFGLHPGCSRWRGVLWYHRAPAMVS
jgi:hypothetical protein